MRITAAITQEVGLSPALRAIRRALGKRRQARQQPSLPAIWWPRPSAAPTNEFLQHVEITPTAEPPWIHTAIAMLNHFAGTP
jgi:hypothetical protein